jgi:microcystin-dependent protein
VADPFVAEIRVVGFNFPPTGWAYCNGQVLPISQNTALFSLLGTNYGGNGASNFALPDIQDSTVIGPGQGPGLTERFIGEQGGVEFVTLIESEMPAHNHMLRANVQPATLGAGAPDRSFARAVGGNIYKGADTPTALMAPQSLAPAGGSLPHNNMMPFLTLNYVIAMQGIFPARP